MIFIIKKHFKLFLEYSNVKVMLIFHSTRVMYSIEHFYMNAFKICEIKKTLNEKHLLTDLLIICCRNVRDIDNILKKTFTLFMLQCQTKVNIFSVGLLHCFISMPTQCMYNK